MHRVRPAQAALILFGFVSALHAQTATSFAPLEQWRQAVIQSDPAALKNSGDWVPVEIWRSVSSYPVY